MDLCLRGSQINLVARPKAKTKSASQTNLHTIGGGTSGITSLRPRSAPFIHRRARSSLHLYRPQSADPRFERNFSSSCSRSTYSSENELFNGLKYNRNNNRFQSVSSSNLLKILLDEPIKRSWLCRSGAGVSSTDEQSDLSSVTSRKTLSSFPNSNSQQQQRRRTNSAGGSSPEGDTPVRLINTPRTVSDTRKSSTRKFSQMASSDSNKEYTNSTRTTDYWSHEPTSLLTSSSSSVSRSKPDLPGRVSFGKVHLHNDIDSSDCDNDKQETYSNKFHAKVPSDGIESISAPGPVKFSLPNFLNKTKTLENDHVTENTIGPSSFKKSVHFGAAGGEILSETYEYPKCPSENCSCSTRSSSTASIHEIYNGKCSCDDSSACKYARDSGCGTSLTDTEYGDVGSIDKTVASPPDELPVIRDYKEAVGAQLENSIVKNLITDSREKSMSSCGSLNNVECSSYLDKYHASSSSKKSTEKQNNLSESKFVGHFKSNSKRNLFDQTDNTEHIKSENNDLSTSKENYASSSDAVISNYLKVSGSTPNLNKKKENKLSAEESSAKPKTKNNGGKITSPAKNKMSDKIVLGNAKKIPKSISFHSLREDSNLNLFNLDKVDSWMSMHDSIGKTQKLSIGNDYEKCGKSKTSATAELEAEDEQGDNNSQLSLKSDDNSQDDSTYDEIVSVIKEIEDDKRKENLAEVAVSEMELKLNTSSEAAESSQNISDRTEASESADKYKDILSYLDNVENSCDKALLETRRSMPESNRSEIEFVVEPDIAEDVPKLADLLLLPNHQLARRVVALSLRANELAHGLHMSKEHVFKLRNEKQKCIRSEKANTTNRLREQKKHYENVVKRHQGFIEQLLKDKGSLCEKVAALTRRLESQNQAWEHKLETEIARVKETTLAGEKIRRERWVRENTKKIKELTVKGLEMEINKMTAQHQQEITELKRAHQQQLLAALEEARLRHEQIENSIRESSAQDRESIIEKERSAIRERFERQLDEERKLFDEQKQKLLEEFAIERERLQQELKLKDAEHQTKRQEFQREKEIEMEQRIAELQERMSKQEEKYQNRINTIEKQYEADFEIWKREYENSCRLAQVDKENSIRQHYRAERDRQIDAIVSRMDSEAEKNAEEYELKLSRIKEKYEKDIRDAEELEKSLREKFAETRNKLAESDAQVRNCQAEMKQLQIELEHSKKMCNDFLVERDQVRDNLRNEMQSEVATLKAERDQEIQKIHKRVQQAIEKKDATIEILQKENGDLRERCIKLEAVIRQQRKDYCIK